MFYRFCSRFEVLYTEYTSVKRVHVVCVKNYNNRELPLTVNDVKKTDNQVEPLVRNAFASFINKCITKL